MGRTVLQQVLHCHWRCVGGARCRIINMEFGEHVMSESAVACPQSHHHDLVFSLEEAGCRLNVLMRLLLKPFSLLALFHYGLCLFKSDSVLFLRQLSTIFHQSVSFLGPWDIAVGWDPLDDCSFTGLFLSIFSFAFPPSVVLFPPPFCSNWIHSLLGGSGWGGGGGSIALLNGYSKPKND